MSPHSNVNKLRECNLKLMEIFEFYVSQSEAFFPSARAGAASCAPPLFIERLQPIKLLYALQLLAIGASELAFRFCEALSTLVLQAARFRLVNQCLLYALSLLKLFYCSLQPFIRESEPHLFVYSYRFSPEIRNTLLDVSRQLFHYQTSSSSSSSSASRMQRSFMAQQEPDWIEQLAEVPITHLCTIS